MALFQLKKLTIFSSVSGVFIDRNADMDDRIQDWNYEATKWRLDAVAREPKAADLLKIYKESSHPFAARNKEDRNRRAADAAITELKGRNHSWQRH